MPKIPFYNDVALLIDNRGRPTPVPREEVEQALAGGFSPAEPEVVKEYLLQQKYGEGIGNELTSAAIGAVGGVVPFGGGAITQGLFGKEAAEEIPKRSPVANVLGTIGGAGLSLAVAPEAKALQALDLVNQASGITKVGLAAEKAVARALPVPKTLIGKVVNEAVSTGAGSAIAGAAFSAGEQATEALLGDPDLTAEKAISNIGFSALASGAFGAVLGAPKGLFNTKSLGKAEAADDIARGIKQDVNSEIFGLSKEEAIKRASTIESAIDDIGVGPAKKQSVLEGLTKLKDNSDDIIKAAKELDAPILESQVSASKHVQDIDSMIMQSPNPVGVARRAKLQQGLDKVDETLKGVLAVDKTLSEAEAGNLIKSGIQARLDSELAPIKKLYDTVKTEFSEIPLIKKDLSVVAKAITEIDGIGLSPSSPEFRLAKSIAKEIDGLTTVDALKQYQTIVRRRTAGAPELKFVAGRIQELLSDLEEKSIVGFAKKAVPKSAEAKSAIDAILSTRSEANARYTAFRDKLSELGSVLGKRKVYGPQDFISFLDDMPPEKLAERLFTKKNSEFLKFFSESFPGEMEILKNQYKAKLFSGSVSDGVIQSGKVISNVKKISKEVRDLLFSSEEIAKLEAAKTYMEALPKNINPSGTSKAEAYRAFYTNPLSATTSTIKDYASLKALELSIDKVGSVDNPKIKTLVRLEMASRAVTKKIEAAAGNIVSAAPAGIAKAVSLSREEQNKLYEKRTKSITNMMTDPELSVKYLQAMTEDTYPAAPNVSGALQMAAVRGAQFLYSKMPSTQATAPLDEPVTASPAQVAKFNHYYDIVNNPLLAMDEIKSGTLSKDTVETLSYVYPALYSEMQAAIFEKISTAKRKPAYQQSLMLSMFVQRPLTSSLFPQSIVKNQLAGNNNRVQNQQQPNPTVGGMQKLGLSGRAATPLEKTINRE